MCTGGLASSCPAPLALTIPGDQGRAPLFPPQSPRIQAPIRGRKKKKKKAESRARARQRRRENKSSGSGRGERHSTTRASNANANANPTRARKQRKRCARRGGATKTSLGNQGWACREGQLAAVSFLPPTLSHTGESTGRISWAMSVSSSLSNFLLCCFYPSAGHRHGHRGGAYYYSSHPTSANTLYYHEGPFAGRRMGRSSRPLSLQVRPLIFVWALALLCSASRLCLRCVLCSFVRHQACCGCVRNNSQMAGRVDACKYGNSAMRMRRDMHRLVLCPPPLVFEFAGLVFRNYCSLRSIAV
jgi:hypothetical protein